MAKGDPTKDYYKELGVQSNASTDDIRKAFRQLALQYHPDRNPGREQQVIAKFQDIQAAHEVLSDAVQRAKYDAERRKLRSVPNIPPYTPRGRPPPAPPRNSYATTPNGTYYSKPPPGRTQHNPPRPTPHKNHSTFTNGADRFTHPNFRAPPTASKTGQEDMFSAWQKMKQSKPEGTRANNPNNPNGTPFGRSNSAKVPTGKKGFNPGTPGGDEGQAKSSYRSNYDRPNPSPVASQDAPPTSKSKPVAEDVPFAEGNRDRTPYASTKSGERTSMWGDGIGRSASVRNSPTYAQRAGVPLDAGINSDSGSRQQRNSFGGSAKKAFPHMYDSSDDDEEVVHMFRPSHKRQDPPTTKPKQPSWAHAAFGTPQKPPGASIGSPSNAFKSKSEENINMKFSPTDWNGKFEGQPDYFAPNVPKGTTNKGRTSPTRGRQHQRSATEKGTFANGQFQPPLKSPFSQSQSQMPPPPPGPPPNAPDHTAKFAPEQWAETFKEPTWALPKETSPRRGSAATKRGNPPRKSSVAPENKQANKPKPRYQAFAEDATNGDAMDIDSESPAAAAAKANPTTPKSTETSAKTSSNSKTGASPVAPTPKPETSGLNLTGMKTVEPFIQTSTGLGGLEDLGDQLPFPSQASSAHPTKPSTAQKLKFPSVPRAPDPPATLDMAAMDAYFRQMEGYINQFEQYSAAITEHCNARREQVAKRDDNFVRQRGEKTHKLGFSSYLQKMKEDEAVLEAWKYAHELHIKALEQCEDVRLKAMNKQSLLESNRLDFEYMQLKNRLKWARKNRPKEASTRNPRWSTSENVVDWEDSSSCRGEEEPEPTTPAQHPSSPVAVAPEPNPRIDHTFLRDGLGVRRNDMAVTTTAGREVPQRQAAQQSPFGVKRAITPPLPLPARGAPRLFGMLGWVWEGVESIWGRWWGR